MSGTRGGMKMNGNKKNSVEVDAIYQTFLHDESFSDIELIVGCKRYRAHKITLAANSRVFQRMLFHPMKETLLNEVVIEDMDADVLEEMLKYMYSRKVGRSELAGELLIAADRYEMDDLKSICEKEMIKYLDVDNVLNFLLISEYHRAEKLKRHCFFLIIENFSEIEKREEYNKLIDTHLYLVLELNREMLLNPVDQN